MCGITGIVKFNSLIEDPLKIVDMNNLLRHRGPDDEGYLSYNKNNNSLKVWGGKETPSSIWNRNYDYSPVNNVYSEAFPKENANLLLGHRRLSILDLSPLGHQPMCDKDGKIWIILNGEIYNYIELKEELISLGYEFISKSDTEVIINSYKEWGEDCIKRFNGMWAFAILDLEHSTLFCSRDRTGVKPFYYFINGEMFAFASEIKALRAILKPSVNEAIVWDYLVLKRSDHSEDTFYCGIKELLPAHCIKCDFDGNFSVKKYWNLCEQIQNGVDLDIEKETEEVYNLIENSVKLRLRSDVRVGSCLSGGLDSSTIVSLVNEILRKDGEVKSVGDIQKTFTSSFNDDKYDERKYVKDLSSKFKIDDHYIFPTKEEFASDVVDLIKIQDEPFSSTSIYAQYRVMKKAKDENVKVLLDGQGGDELFGGYFNYQIVYLFELLKENKFKTFIDELKDSKRINNLGYFSHLKRMLIEFAKAYFLKPALYASKFAFDEFKILNKDFFFSHLDRVENFLDRWREPLFSLNHKLRSDFTIGQLTPLLRYEDRNSMAFSIEARTPFSDDVELIEKVMRLPSEMKIRNGFRKYILRKAMDKILPQSICWRKDKMGFVTPETNWIKYFLKNGKNYFAGEDLSFINRQSFEILRKDVENGEIVPPDNMWRMLNIILWGNLQGRN